MNQEAAAGKARIKIHRRTQDSSEASGPKIGYGTNKPQTER